MERVLDPPTWQAGMTSRWDAAWPQPNVLSGTPPWGFLAASSDADGIQAPTNALRVEGPVASGFAKSRVLGSYYAQGFRSYLLRTPGGLRAILKDPQAFGLLVVDASTGAVVGQLGTYFPPGLSYFSPDYVHPAGDVNGDGFDDFFVDHTGTLTSGARVDGTALVDGATLTRTWEMYEPSDLNYGVWHHGPGLAPDLNSDGHPDHAVSARSYLPTSQTYETTFIAVSGTDGAEIWRRALPGISNGPNVFVPDATGDGVAELCVARFTPQTLATSSLVMLDGATGTVLWQHDVAQLVPQFSQGSLVSLLHCWVALAGTSSESATPEIVCLVEGVYLGAIEYGWVHIDAATGQQTGWSPEATDLSPWSTDPLSIFGGNGTHHYPIGDIDRDGLPETAAPASALGWPSQPGVPSWRLVILGEQTLDCPSSVSLGDVLTIDVRIPSAPGLTTMLLASSTFDPVGGFIIDGWETNLGAPDPVLTLSLAYSASTVLDAKGHGSFQVVIPPLATLVGQTISLRSVVFEAGSATRVWTISSLGQTEVLP